MTGCAGEAPYEDVDKATALFFHRLEGEQYDVIYDDSSDYYRETVTRPSALESLKQVKALGNHATPARVQMLFETYKGNRVAEPVYSVLFEQARTEFTLKFMDDGGEWKLMGFAVKQRLANWWSEHNSDNRVSSFKKAIAIAAIRSLSFFRRQPAPVALPKISKRSPG